MMGDARIFVALHSHLSSTWLYQISSAFNIYVHLSSEKYVYDHYNHGNIVSRKHKKSPE